MTQTEQLKRHLESGKSITNEEAWREYGIYACSQRLTELRKRGLPIKTELIEVQTRNGTARIAKWSLEVPESLFDPCGEGK